MGITRKILEWTDTKQKEGMAEDNLTKVALGGFVEGMVDGCVVWYPIVLGAAYYWKKQALKK